MWIIVPAFGAPLMTALTMTAWYSVSSLIGGPPFDLDKLGPIVSGWVVIITVGFWSLIAWEELRPR